MTVAHSGRAVYAASALYDEQDRDQTEPNKNQTSVQPYRPEPHRSTLRGSLDLELHGVCEAAPLSSLASTDREVPRDDRGHRACGVIFSWCPIHACGFSAECFDADLHQQRLGTKGMKGVPALCEGRHAFFNLVATKALDALRTFGTSRRHPLRPWLSP